MIVMTITLRDTEHQVLLGFKKIETMDAAVNAMMDMSKTVRLLDDYGQSALVLGSDVLAVEFCDAVAQWDFRNEIRIAKLKGESAYRNILQQQPDLQFLVGRDLEIGSR